MQSLMLFVMILALATIAIGIALALQYDTKEAFVFMLIAGVMIAAVYYVAKTSNMITVPDAAPVGLWSLALVPIPRKQEDTDRLEKVVIKVFGYVNRIKINLSFNDISGVWKAVNDLSDYIVSIGPEGYDFVVQDRKKGGE